MKAHDTRDLVLTGDHKRQIMRGCTRDEAGCLIWDESRHPTISVYSRAARKNVQVQVTRALYAIDAHGELGPDDVLVHQHCDNTGAAGVPLCIEPAHQRKGTRHDMQELSLKRGRNVQAKKTTCPSGHPYDGMTTRGHRTCSVCVAAAHKKSKANKQKSVPPPTPEDCCMDCAVNGDFTH